MTAADPPRSAAPEAGRPAGEVEQAIRRRVVEQADRWFPDVRPNPDVRLRRMVERPRAVLYAVHLDGGAAPRILAKVRRGGAAGGEPAGARPRLASGTLSLGELTTLEFAGLHAIAAMVDGGDPRFDAVRPLDHLVAEDTILMEYVEAPTARQVLLGLSRLSPRRRRTGADGAPEVWQRAGAWLGLYQRHLPHAGLPRRQETREAVAERFRAYGAFLTDRLGRRAGDAARAAADLAEDVLPERLPLAAGHGDYAPRNVFVRADGRLAVFDPLPRWSVPALEDLCRFLVAMRLLGVQVHTHGAAYRAADLDRWESAVLEGYRGTGDLPAPEQLRCYQLLVTLDKWSALVDGPSAGARGRVRRVAVRLAAGYLCGEADRLLQAARTAE